MPIINKPKTEESVQNIPKNKDEKKVIEFILKKPKYTFNDIVLTSEMKSDILDALSVFELKDKLFLEWNLQSVIKKPASLCINFYGEPGTGKSMVANAVADYLKLQIIQVDYSDIESKYVGETAKNLTKLFQVAQEKNAVIIFDEADALLSKRVTDMSSANDVSVNQTRSVLLTLMDEYQGIVLFTTNFISNFDSAFMRRIPYHIKFDFPNEEVRTTLFTHYLTNTVPHTIDIPRIAQISEGITGSDIANALMNTALKTARSGQVSIEHEHFETAILSVLESKRANKQTVSRDRTVTRKIISETEVPEEIRNIKEDEL